MCSLASLAPFVAAQDSSPMLLAPEPSSLKDLLVARAVRVPGRIFATTPRQEESPAKRNELKKSVFEAKVARPRSPTLDSASGRSDLVVGSYST